MSRWTSDTSTPRSCMMSASELRGGRSRASSPASFSSSPRWATDDEGLPAVASMIDISTIFHGKIGRFRIRTTSWSGS